MKLIEISSKNGIIPSQLYKEKSITKISNLCINLMLPIINASFQRQRRNLSFIPIEKSVYASCHTGQNQVYTTVKSLLLKVIVFTKNNRQSIYPPTYNKSICLQFQAQCKLGILRESRDTHSPKQSLVPLNPYILVMHLPQLRSFNYSGRMVPFKGMLLRLNRKKGIQRIWTLNRRKVHLYS